MGLKDTFKRAAVTAFNAFDDIPEEVSFQTYASSDYNVSTGVASAYAQRTLSTMVFTRYKEHQIDGERIQFNDVMGLTPQNKLPIRPKKDDKVHRIENEQSVVYDILDIHEDPAAATWKFQLRKL